uniref:protein-tyrosine-phosphatase n=1 Tax=Oryzias sinensis TaxID=183150 RepID=A0A8C7YC66_9TELE
SLNWTAPPGQVFTYKVEWCRGGCQNSSIIFVNKSFAITSHKYGNVTSKLDCKKHFHYICHSSLIFFFFLFLEPDVVKNLRIVSVTTTSVSLSWDKPEGSADSYIVRWNSTKENSSNKTNSLSFNITNLTPGVLYNISVTAVAGNEGNQVFNKTFTSGFTDSENLSKYLKSGAPDISFLITYNDKTVKTEGNSKELQMLKSGTLYNITIATVGPQNLSSTAIQNSSYTLPNPVLKVEVRLLSTTSVMVNWTEPQDFHGYYQYLVQTYNLTNAVVSFKNVSSTSIIIENLEPGSQYFTNVTTIAAAGSESPAVQTSFHTSTKPKAVTGLRNVSETTSIQLTWQRQSDFKSSYKYLVEAYQGAVLVQNRTVEQETYNFTELSPGTLYNFFVSVVVDKVFSEKETISSQTIPEKVPQLTATGTTTSLNVIWTAPRGQVSSYSIRLFKNNVLVSNKTAPNSSTYELFERLDPGVLYQVQLVTISGPVQSNSNTVSNATFPTPPGPITVVGQTVRSINFTWSPPNNMSQDQYNFTVQSNNTKNTITIQRSWSLLEGLQSGSPYFISVITVGVLGYQSTAVKANKYSSDVSNLTRTQITTDSVDLRWDQLESKPYYSYNVQAFNSSYSEIFSSNNSTTYATVYGLQSGTTYTFNVTTAVPDGTRSEPSMVSYSTRLLCCSRAVCCFWFRGTNLKYNFYFPQLDTTQSVQKLLHVHCENHLEPEKAKPSSVQSDGSNSSILVSWTFPSGNVEMYRLTLNSTGSGYNDTKKLNSNTTSFSFEGLKAGTLYSARLTTCSGPFCEDSDYVTNATFPNPPGPIKILNQTTSSIQVEWGEAPLMSSGFDYKLLIYPTGNIIVVPSHNTSFTFISLLSGTPYNISVKTVGPMGLESGSVFRTGVSTSEAFYFCVDTFSITGTSEQYTISQLETITIPDLVPGTLYILSVITQTADGTQAAPNTTQTWTSRIHASMFSSDLCGTMLWGGGGKRVKKCHLHKINIFLAFASVVSGVSRVTNLMCVGPNRTDPQIWLSWKKAAGLSTAVIIQVANQNYTVPSNSCSSEEWCNYTVSNLQCYTEYRVDVWTQSSGQYSPSVVRDCLTGIREPAIPSNYLSMANVSATEYHKFTIVVSRDLLNKSSGPITHVGVLLTQSIAGLVLADVCPSYLTKTYNDRKSGSLEAYLTAVQTPVTGTRSASNLIIDVGTSATWESYVNGELEEGQTYRYAIALFTSLQLNASRVDDVNSIVSITNFYPSIVLLKNSGAPSHQRFSSQHPLSRSAAVRVEDFEAYYQKQKADSNCGFAEEFEVKHELGSSFLAVFLPRGASSHAPVCTSDDSSRVKLSIIHGDPCDDYINANYMPGYQSKKEFIAAQGPLPGTVNDFWRMIWEKNVRTMVMLTRCNEQGRVKCEQYWASGVKSCGDIIVKTTSDIILDDWTIKDFNIKNVKTAEMRAVRHFHFTAWPDHGVPETTELLISFRHLVREHMDQYSQHSPTVVHCSAGVGRTGTFIAIDRLIFQIERENIVDIFGIVHNLRMHRPLMVQTEDQYVFLNQCALDFIRSRTGNNVDLIYQNTAALSIYENISPKKRGY